VRRVAIHQPNLFPWLGFFAKMQLADVFVLLDVVPFNRRGYQHRVRIDTPSGARWLTLPVLKKGRYGEVTNQVEIDSTRPWRHDQFETLRHNYARAPVFAELVPHLRELYERPHERLVGFTVPGIEWIRSELRIDTELVLASELLDPGLAGSELLAELVLACGGDTYVSGPSGHAYMDDAVFSSRGVALEFTQFAPFEYEQGHPKFIGGLSALDFLFNVQDAASFWRSQWEKR
jgi:WbqC-like protein family